MKFARILFMVFFLFFSTSSPAFYRIAISPKGESYYNAPPNTAIQKSDVIGLDSFVHSDSNCSIDDYSLDPTGNFIGVKEYCRLAPSDTDCTETADRKYRISVFEIENRKRILSFDHGFSFAFSPDGKEIAISARFPDWHDEGCKYPPGFAEVGGLWIYNFATGQKKKVDTMTVGVMHLNWSPHDGNIYVCNNRDIFRYDVSTGQGELVDLPGYQFSPDGKYVIGRLSPPMTVFRAEEQTPADEINSKLKGLGKYLSFKSWVLGGQAMLIDVDGEKTIVFDIESRQVMQEFTGRVIGGNPEGTKLLIHPVAKNNKGQMVTNREAVELIEIKSGH